MENTTAQTFAAGQKFTDSQELKAVQHLAKGLGITNIPKATPDQKQILDALARAYVHGCRVQSARMNGATEGWISKNTPC